MYSKLQDHVSEALTTIDACGIILDLSLNFDLTRLYLDVVAIYVRLLILLSRVDDRKAVLGLFNAAHEMVHGACDPAFPRCVFDRFKYQKSHADTAFTSISCMEF